MLNTPIKNMPIIHQRTFFFPIIRKKQPKNFVRKHKSSDFPRNFKQAENKSDITHQISSPIIITPCMSQSFVNSTKEYEEFLQKDISKNVDHPKINPCQSEQNIENIQMTYSKELIQQKIHKNTSINYSLLKRYFYQLEQIASKKQHNYQSLRKKYSMGLQAKKKQLSAMDQQYKRLSFKTKFTRIKQSKYQNLHTKDPICRSRLSPWKQKESYRLDQQNM